MATYDKVRIDCIIENLCPECGGELDTGWECNRCYFDAMREHCIFYEQSNTVDNAEK
jgi:hypothetical protein